MNYRHLIATACASAVIAGGVVAPATAHAHVDIDPLSRECKEATAAAKRGAPIPHMDRFVFSDNENALVENTLYLYAPDHLKPHIDRATKEWVKATNGLVRFEYVDKPGYKVVTVQEANLGGSVGRVTGNVHNMKVLINPDTIRGGHQASITMTLAHEIGHAMGLAHSCDGALMKVGNNRGKSATTPQALDAQVLIQHNNLKQYGGRPPKPSTTAAPAPEPSTSKPAPAPVEPTTSEPAPVVPEPSTPVIPEPSTPEISTVVTTVPATTTTETTVIETVVVEEPTSAEPAPEETTKVAPVEELPKPTTLQEALDAVKEAKRNYIAADAAATAAQKTGEGIDEAEAAADAAWSVLQAAQNNLEEFKAQHPDATLEPEPQPTSEVTTRPEVTTPRSTTTAKATTSAPTTTSTTSRTSTTSPTLKPTPTTQTQVTKATTTTKSSEVAPSTSTKKATTSAATPSAQTTTSRTSAVAPSSTPRLSTKTSTTKVTPTTRTTVTRATKATTTTKPSEVAPSTSTKKASTSATTPSAESTVTTTSTKKPSPSTTTRTSAQVTVTTSTKATTTAAATTVVEIPEGSVVDKSTSVPTTITESLEIPAGKEDGSAKSSSTSPLAIIVPSILLVLTGLGAVGFYLYKHYF